MPLNALRPVRREPWRGLTPFMTGSLAGFRRIPALSGERTIPAPRDTQLWPEIPASLQVLEPRDAWPRGGGYAPSPLAPAATPSALSVCASGAMSRVQADSHKVPKQVPGGGQLSAAMRSCPVAAM